MISARGVARAAVVAVMVMLAAGAARADTHAPWPTDWNNWNDPALWVPVGNPGNAPDTRYATPGYGAVAYEYNIGKYEVTAGQYTAFLNAVAGVDTYALYNTDMSDTGLGSGIARTGGGTVGSPYTYSVATAFTNRPVNYVSWGDAARFANWLSNGQPTGDQGLTTTEDGAYYLNGATSIAPLLAVTRKADWKWAITSEDEWYKAAHYDPTTGTYFDYPTSTNSEPGRDMTEATNPGNNANYCDTDFGTYPIDSGMATTVAGEFELSHSPYGTFDQGGNVWEWNEAVIESYRGYRGGSWADIVIGLEAAYRGGYYPTYESYYVGFRVSEVPEPATLSLLALGGLAAILRRRGR